MLALYALTLFLSAALLFWVQPLIGKMLLPLFGGTPAVWNTCMVFFQAALLTGYGYAHLSARWLPMTRQVRLHLLVLLVPVLLFPLFSVDAKAAQPDRHPLLALLATLLRTAGAPFLLVSTTAPLLQRWFGSTAHPAARDPYFLYAASNLGSMLVLLGYPVLIEPRLPLVQQGRMWEAGYVVLGTLIALCALPLLASGARAPREEVGPAEAIAAPSLASRLLWVALSLCPSSLLLGVTTHLTTNIAAIPLLWVVPLALYLLSFILVFARRPPIPHRLMVLLLPLVILPLVFVLSAHINIAPAREIALHLAVFFVACMVCHGELLRTRPHTQHLTLFYLCVSVGGVLGGVLNALVAPLVFNSLFEYPLMLVLSCLFVPESSRGQRLLGRLGAILAPAALGLLCAGLTLKFPAGSLRPNELRTTAVLACYACIVLTCLVFVLMRRPLLFAFSIGAIVLVSHGLSDRGALHRTRSFFGVLLVKDDPKEGVRKLIHGTTLHGTQRLLPDGSLSRSPRPEGYYDGRGPAGRVLGALSARLAEKEIAVIGMGTGALCRYAREGQRWSFYEIDPAVVAIAQNPAWFTHLAECKARVETVIGDGRLMLARAPDARLGLLILDAFSSDAIPVHLLTREALDLYLRKLGPDGVLLLHISNRYLRISGVVARLAASAGLQARLAHHVDGEVATTWAVLARRTEHLGAIAADPLFAPLVAAPSDPLWTDDFSNLLGVLRL